MSEESSASPRSKLRIENLSDLVFGLALSVGSIALISRLPQTPFDLASSIVLFGFSFVIVIWVWSGYTRTMSLLPFEVRWTYILNIALLFCVVIEPYLFYVMDASPISLLDFASSIYALDTAAMMFMLAGLVYLLRGEEKRGNVRKLGRGHLERLRRVMLAEVSSGAIFAFSALPFLWIPTQLGSYMRFDLWYGSFIIFFGLVSVRSRRKGGLTMISPG